jgi:hypothetical protein
MVKYYLVAVLISIISISKTRLALGGNFDQKDPYFISLKEELERLFKKKNWSCLVIKVSFLVWLSNEKECHSI